MKDFIRLVSINVEIDKHFEKVSALLEKIRPDIFCAQEILESDFDTFKDKFKMGGVFKPMARHFIISKNKEENSGVAILSHLPIKDVSSFYYRGQEEEIMMHDKSSLDNLNKTVAKVLLCLTVESEDKSFEICTTQFTWTPNGEADQTQRDDLSKMFSFLDKKQSVIICGDFNAPRGGEIFTKIASKYKDNVPSKYDSSIDPNLHRVKGLRLMVDGLFSTPDYLVKNVELIEGVSDHKAVVGEVYKI